MATQTPIALEAYLRTSFLDGDLRLVDALALPEYDLRIAPADLF